jgi:hypothetical protein
VCGQWAMAEMVGEKSDHVGPDGQKCCGWRTNQQMTSAPPEGGGTAQIYDLNSPARRLRGVRLRQISIVKSRTLHHLIDLIGEHTAGARPEGGSTAQNLWRRDDVEGRSE